jgi:hypothetical protein
MFGTGRAQPDCSSRSATIIAANSLESVLGLSRPTIARYLRAPEEIYLVKRIPGWSRNLGTRATAAPKLIFVDSGIATNEIAIDARALLRPGAVRAAARILCPVRAVPPAHLV